MLERGKAREKLVVRVAHGGVVEVEVGEVWVLVAEVQGALVADAPAARQVQVPQLPHVAQGPVIPV